MDEQKPSRRRRHNIQQFEKGINQRVNIEKGDPSRLHKLQNARLHGRGNTLSVERMQGHDVKVSLPDDVEKVLDVVYGPNNDLVVFSKLTNSRVRVSVYLEVANGNLFENHTWTLDSDTQHGTMLRKDNTILISPINKMLNYINNTYFLNNTVTPRPIIRSIDVFDDDQTDEPDTNVVLSYDFESGDDVVDDAWLDPNSGDPVGGLPINARIKQGLESGKEVQVKYLAYDSSGNFDGTRRLEWPFSMFDVPEAKVYEMSYDIYFERVFAFSTIGQDYDELVRRLTEIQGLTEDEARTQVTAMNPNSTYRDTGFPYQTGKLHGMMSNYVGETPAGRAPVDPDEWSARVVWVKNTKSHPNQDTDGVYVDGADPNIGPTVALYVYDQDRQDGDTGTFYFPEWSFQFEKERWYTIKLTIQLNDVGKRNGTALLCVYDRRTDSLLAKIFYDNFKFHDSATVSDAYIKRFFFSTFFGGGDLRYSPKLHSEWDQFVDLNSAVYTRQDNYQMKSVDELVAPTVSTTPFPDTNEIDFTLSHPEYDRFSQTMYCVLPFDGEYSVDTAQWNYVPYENKGTTSSTFTLTGLKQGDKVYFRLNEDLTPRYSAKSDVYVVDYNVLDEDSIKTFSLTPKDESFDLTYEVIEEGAIVEYKIENGNWRTLTGLSGTETVTQLDGGSTLVNGQVYEVELKVDNGISVVISNPLSVKPRTVPSITTSNVRYESDQIKFEYTINDEGSVLESLDVRYKIINGTYGNWLPQTVSKTGTISIDVADGFEYEFQFRVTNGVGSSVVTHTQKTPPETFTIDTVSGDQTIDIVYDAPNNGGDAITGYEYTLNDVGPLTPDTWTNTGFVLNGLFNGTPYDIKVRASNNIGVGGWSNVVTETPYAVLNSSIVNTFTLTPADQSIIMDYDFVVNDLSANAYYRIDTEWRQIGMSGSRTITQLDDGSPLVNGTQYTIDIKVENPVDQYTFSSSETPATLPSITTENQRWVFGDEIVFDYNIDSNGRPIDNVEIRYREVGGTFSTWTSQGTSTTGTAKYPVTKGIEYEHEIRVTTTVGSTVVSSPAQTPPASPVIDQVVHGDRQLTVEFTPPANGGSAIQSYLYQVDNNIPKPATVTNNTFTITELENGTSYNIKLKAINEVDQSDYSNVVTQTPSGQPSATMSIDDVGETEITFSYSLDGNGTAITNRYYTINGGTQQSLDANSGTEIVGGLDSDTYMIVVQVANKNGTDSASDSGTTLKSLAPVIDTNSTTTGDGSATFEWTYIPYKAVIDSIVTGDSQLTVYASVLHDGNLPISWEYDIGQGWQSGGVSSPFTITGLTNNTEYSVKVRAVNVEGTGEESASVPATPTATPTEHKLNFSSGSLQWATPNEDVHEAVIVMESGGYDSTSAKEALLNMQGFGIPYMLIGSVSGDVNDEVLTLYDSGPLRDYTQDNIPSGIITLQIEWTGSKYKFVLNGTDMPMLVENDSVSLQRWNEFGARNGSDFFTGKLHSLTLYGSGGKIHEWLCNEGIGTTVVDSVGNNDATLTGNVNWELS